MRIKEYLLNILNLRSLKRLKKNCYTTLDELPLYNWWKVIETSDLNWLKKKDKFVEISELEAIWEKLNDEFYDTFGISQDLREYLLLKRELLLLEIDSYMTKDPFLRTLIKIKQTEVEKYENKQQKVDYYVVKANVEKYMGIKIDPKTTSVRDYYAYIQLIEQNGNKEDKE